MLHKYYKDGQQLDVAGLNKIIVLIDRSESELSEIGFNEWRPQLDGPPHKHGDKDQVFYITNGIGKVKLGDETFAVKEDSVYHSLPEISFIFSELNFRHRLKMAMHRKANCCSNDCRFG